MKQKLNLKKEYHEAKVELEQIYDYITEGIILRSRSTSYEKGEKSTKYFLTLEKGQKSKTFVKRLISRENELSIIRMFHSLFANSILICFLANQ